jgi:glycosyltransferase involved in cell wall biosynthesis
MRIVELGPWPPPHGGVQTNIVDIRRYLRERGHYCAVVNLTRFRRADGDDVFFPKTPLQVLNILRRLRCDVIHIHIGGDLRLIHLGLCLTCSLLPGAKTVLTFHSGGYPTWPAGHSAGRWTLRGVVLRRLDRVIAVNDALRDLFLRFGVPKERVRLIYPFAVKAPENAEYPEKLAHFIEKHRPFLLTVGLLEPEYDLPLQIETLGRIRERHPAAGLVIAGAGSLEEELRQRIAAQPWAEHILLWGDLPHAITLRAIQECDILLRTTLFDGDSISVREALAFGTPVIATDNGMRPRGVHLVPLRDSERLVEAVSRCVKDAGADKWQNAMGDESNLEAVVREYRDLLGRS